MTRQIPPYFCPRTAEYLIEQLKSNNDTLTARLMVRQMMMLHVAQRPRRIDSGERFIAACITIAVFAILVAGFGVYGFAAFRRM